MYIIREYLDSLFLAAPQTEAMVQAKEELLATMEDHYYELIESGKSENEALGAVISEFGSIDELLNEVAESEMMPGDNFFSEEVSGNFSASQLDSEDVFIFWGETRHFALYLSAGIFTGSVAVSSAGFFSNLFGSGLIGAISFFVLMIASVWLMVQSILRYYPFYQTIKQQVATYEQKEIAVKELDSYQNSFVTGVILGGMHLLGAAPLGIILMNNWYLGFWEALPAASLTAGVGVSLIVYVSIIYSGYLQIKKEHSEFSRTSFFKQSNKRVNESFLRILIRNFYWPVILFICFLFVSITYSLIPSVILFIFAVVLRNSVVHWERQK